VISRGSFACLKIISTTGELIIDRSKNSSYNNCKANLTGSVNTKTETGKGKEAALPIVKR
jgi:hypothetical protein